MKCRLLREAGSIIIPQVELIGHHHIKGVDMILDTGATYSILSWDTVLALGYPQDTHRPIVSLVTASGNIDVPLVILRQIIIQNIVVRNVPVYCHDMPDEVGVSGLIGLHAIKKLCTTIDYRRLMLTME